MSVIGNAPPPPDCSGGIDPHAVKKHGEAGWWSQYRNPATVLAALVSFVLVIWLGLPILVAMFNPFGGKGGEGGTTSGPTPSREIEVYWQKEPPPADEPEFFPPPAPQIAAPALAASIAEPTKPAEPKIDTAPPPEDEPAPSDEPSLVYSPETAAGAPGGSHFGPISKKANVIGEAPKQDDYAKSALFDERLFGCVIQPGYVLEGHLVHAINSEVPGEAVIELRSPYYPPDDPFAEEPLLPANTRFVVSTRREQGGPGSKLGHTRLELKVITATTPVHWRPRRLALEDKRIAVLSGDGSMGIGGEVETNLFNTLLYGGVLALIDAGSRTVTDEESAAGRLRGAATERYGDIARDYVDSLLEVGPTIKVAAGERVLLLFSDAVLSSHKCLG